MNKQTKGYSTTITVHKSPKDVFDAINNVGAWWSGHIEGSSSKLGDEFIYTYKNFHRSTQKVTDFVPGKRIVWHVKDGSISFLKNKSEWVGTDIVFDLEKKGDDTQLKFTHVGIVPGCECYSACSEGWGSLIQDNLKNYIETGEMQADALA